MASKDDLEGISKIDDFSDMKYVVQGESFLLGYKEFFECSSL